MRDTWKQVDDYVVGKLFTADPDLDWILESSDAAGLPAINVTPPQAKLLHLMAKAQKAERILEIGTLGGYSTTWLALSLPAEGQLITMELEPHHAELAEMHFDRANVADRIDIRVGEAITSLEQLEAENGPSFDFVFIDADKKNNCEYFTRALRLVRDGGVIIVDNVVRGGNVIDESADDPSIAGTRALLDYIQQKPRVSATAIQTVGGKSYDGFLMAVVNSGPRSDPS